MFLGDEGGGTSHVLVALWLELSLQENETERNPFLRHSSESRRTRLISKALFEFSSPWCGFRDTLLMAAFLGVRK